MESSFRPFSRRRELWIFKMRIQPTLIKCFVYSYKTEIIRLTLFLNSLWSFLSLKNRISEAYLLYSWTFSSVHLWTSTTQKHKIRVLKQCRPKFSLHLHIVELHFETVINIFFYCSLKVFTLTSHRTSSSKYVWPIAWCNGSMRQWPSVSDALIGNARYA